MDFEGTNSPENQNLEEMYKSLTNISKQLQLLQDFVQSKFGNEFTKFCELSETTTNQTYASNESNSLQEDNEDYDKMPNLVSQESPSRTLGFVSVPLRQTNSGIPTPKLHPAPSAAAGSSKRGDRSSFNKDGGLQGGNDNEDMMLQLHNFPDLLVENTGEMDTGETPEFLELELDPINITGEPPPLHPMFADNDQDINIHIGNGSSSGTHTKRSVSRQSGVSFNRMELDASTRVSRRASFGGHENSGFQKKFDCLICGIKFEYAETLKSHMDSHAGARNMRSNSEDQSALGSNSTNAPPLPKLMPRPSIPTPNSVPSSHSLEIKPEPGTRLPPRPKKSSSSSSMSPSSSTSVSSRAAAMKRRKRYNQSRPSALACPECGLKIRDKSRLIEHLRGHTGERPFQCTYCDKSYTRKDVLKTHMIKMHGEAP